MRDLDSLYGKGTAAAFIKAIGATVEQAEVPDGVRLYVEWEDGSTMRVDCFAEQWHFLSLASNRKGLAKHVVKSLSAITPVKRWTAGAANPDAEAVLLKVGGKKVGHLVEWRF